MGRKQTLRRQQHQKKNKQNMKKESMELTTIATDTDTDIDELDNEFPKSEFFVKGHKLLGEQNDGYCKPGNISELFMRGATEHGCVHSMHILGDYYTLPATNGKSIHLAQPFLLEGSLSGSINCLMELVSGIYMKVKQNPPQALILYWMKMQSKYEDWSTCSGSISDIKRSKMMNYCKEMVTRSCAVCGKQDTNRLTLTQCVGCSTYCYCSRKCQTIQWAQQGHRGECKQLQILLKYHKPYAKEIRKAAIRGETHPALEKLKHKLGLSRPVEDYDMLRNYGIHEGKPIKPYQHVVARDDGTVWIGTTTNNAPSRFRYTVGQTVACMTDDWEVGVITQINYWQPGFKNPVPYQIRLLSGKYIYAPEDSDNCIRLVE